ncbi:hypothetical protein MMC28_005480 [Mycoblastus sanguinarius]|nr:hypothetical protein [Mycoblastus sanguinarius]
MPYGPCDLLPDCTRNQHELMQLNTDLADVRAALRKLNSQRQLQQLPNHLEHIRTQYQSFFGHGSGHGSNTIASLRDIEHYLEDEIRAVGNVDMRQRILGFCLDDCWEALVIRGREAHEAAFRARR